MIQFYKQVICGGQSIHHSYWRGIQEKNNQCFLRIIVTINCSQSNQTIMDKDYVKSKKYTQDELDNLDIPYKFKDFCQEDYANYTSCVRIHPRVIENSFVYLVPFSEALSNCKILRKKWLKCEEYREKELFEEMKKIYDLQQALV